MILLIFGLVFTAFFLLWISLKITQRAAEVRKINNIIGGKVTYSDLQKPAKALFSEELNLTGKPDYIVKTKEGRVPVEFKSTTAVRPYDNHIIQLISYCALVEKNFKDYAPYGMLVYSNNSKHKIMYNSSRETDLKNTMKKMRDILRSGHARRNHNIVSKCLNCSFREACPEKLE